MSRLGRHGPESLLVGGTSGPNTADRVQDGAMIRPRHRKKVPAGMLGCPRENYTSRNQTSVCTACGE